MLKLLFIMLVLTLLPLYSSSESYLDEAWKWEGIRVFTLRINPEKSSRFKDIDGYSNVDLADLYFQLPLIPKRKLHIGLGAWYRQVYADLANFETSQQLDYTTHVLRGVITSAYRFNARYYIYGEYHCGIDGKWNNLTSDIINHQAILFIGFVPMKNRMFRLGAVYARLYGKHMVLPILGSSFACGKRSAFDFLFPTHLLYRIRIAPRYEVGTRTFISTADFGTEDISSRPVVLSFTQVGTTLYNDFKVIHKPEKNLSLRARIEGGFYHNRTTTLNNLDGSEIMRAKLKPAPMCSFSFRWAI